MVSHRHSSRSAAAADFRWSLAAAGLGISAITTQTVLLREFLSVFAGNELIIGIVLANWMVLTGIGALAGRWSRQVADPSRRLAELLWGLSLLPLFTVFALHGLRNTVFPVGTLIGIVESFAGSFLLLSPYCLLAGFSFTFCVRVVTEAETPDASARVYALEAAGSVAGGVAFNLLLLYVLSAYQILLLLTALNFGIAHAVSRDVLGGGARRILLAAAPVVLIVLGLAQLDGLARRLLFPGQEVVFRRDTPYGNLTVTRQGTQENVFENGILLFSTGDVVSSEEAVHYAMIQHPRPRRVLLVGGGVSGVTAEILKYDVDRIDYVELNPWVVRVGRMLTSVLDDPRVHIFTGDARRFIRETGERYDVVLTTVPDPTTAQLNRFYTLEFLRELKSVLTEGAVVSFGLLAQVDYYGEEARRVNSILHATLQEVFRHVLIVPGFRNAFVASDRTLNVNVARMVADRGIPTTYVNEYYIDDTLVARRSRDIERSLLPDVQVNTDFHPVAYYRQVLYWLGYFELHLWLPLLAGCAVLLLIVARLNVVTFGMAVAGFAGSTIEVVLLVAFQVLYGYVYHLTGLIITMFMAGLAAGAFLHRRLWRRGIVSYAVLQSLTGLVCLVLPLLFLGLQSLSAPAVVSHLAFFGAAFGAAFLAGSQFGVATTLLRSGAVSAASDLYGIDLLGSAIGALAVSVVLIPLLGIADVSLVLGAVCLLASAVSFLGRKKYIADGR